MAAHGNFIKNDYCVSVSDVLEDWSSKISCQSIFMFSVNETSSTSLNDDLWQKKVSPESPSSDDETGRKLTGKDLQIDGINQHD